MKRETAIKKRATLWALVVQKEAKIKRLQAEIEQHQKSIAELNKILKARQPILTTRMSKSQRLDAIFDYINNNY